MSNNTLRIELTSAPNGSPLSFTNKVEYRNGTGGSDITSSANTITLVDTISTSDHIKARKSSNSSSMHVSTTGPASGGISNIEIKNSGHNYNGSTITIWHCDTASGTWTIFTKLLWSNLTNGVTATGVLTNLRQSEGTPTAASGFTVFDLEASTAHLKTYFAIVLDNGTDGDYVIEYCDNANCFSPTTPMPKIVPVSTLMVGDLVRTNIGDQRISKIMTSDNIGGKQEYVIFMKNCFGNNLPNQDVQLTPAHPLSIGYFKVTDINNNKSDPEQDEKVFVHIAANSLVGKLPGINKEIIDAKTNYNLIFDTHCSIEIGGLDLVTHHPCGNDVFTNPKLNDDEFQDPENATKKNDKPFYMDYDTLLKYKPEDMEIKEFLGKVFTYDVNKKFKFGYINPEDNLMKDLFKY